MNNGIFLAIFLVKITGSLTKRAHFVRLIKEILDDRKKTDSKYNSADLTTIAHFRQSLLIISINLTDIILSVSLYTLEHCASPSTYYLLITLMHPLL